MSDTSTEKVDWRTYWKSYLCSPDVSTRYFYLHLTGIGYITRIREKTKQEEGESRLYVDVAAFHGPLDQLKYTNISATVTGADSQKLVRQCRQSVDAQSKVLIAFRIGEPFVHQFKYDFGPRMGEYNARLEGRLLSIGWIKIDGQLVYSAVRAEESSFNGHNTGEDIGASS